MPVDLTVGAVLALGADRNDPNLRRIHQIVHGENDCSEYQYRLLPNHKIGLVKVLNPPPGLHSLCPSRGEGLFGSGRRRRVG